MRRTVLALAGLGLLLAAWPLAASAPHPPQWATLVGGPGQDEVEAVAMDPDGNVYVAGRTDHYDPCCADESWVAKYGPDGRRLWVADLGGPGREYDLSIAYRNGVLAVGGLTSGDFPTTPGAWLTTPHDAFGDGFVVRLDPATGAVRWATLVGGSDGDAVLGVDVDDAGNVYAAGDTFSCDFPVTTGAYQRVHGDGCAGPVDAFAVKLPPDGSRAVYSTLLGGRGGDVANDLAVSPTSGSILLTGWTTSLDYDVTAGAYDTTHNGEADVFVTKLDASGSRLLFSTLIGGPGDDDAFAVARDSSSNVYVTGVIDSPGFPVTAGAHQTQFVGGDCGNSKVYRECFDGYVLKLDAGGAALRWSTLIAADKDDWPADIAVDAAGAAYVAGHTSSPNFPATDGRAKNATGAEPFAAAVAPSGRALLYATTFGAEPGSSAAALAARPDGTVVVGGDAYAFPATPGADRTVGEGREGFLAKLGPPTQGLVFDHTGGNEWYVEVALGGREADHVARVEVRDAGGAWATLPKQPYGKWGGGHHVEPGNTVEFRATLSNGVVRTSCTFTHPAGECATTPSFDAAFTNVKGNAWWVEAKVSGNEPIAKVEASVNGGAWRALTLRSWGAWAASFSVPEGSIVQLRATSTSGATDLSGCYRWTAATPVECGGTDPGDFDATFRNVRGNEWWIETDVSVTGGTLAGVDARVNGGTWIPLEKKSYGSWAKSIHAPAGSTVEFRARATDGSTDVSSAYRWPPG